MNVDVDVCGEMNISRKRGAASAGIGVRMGESIGEQHHEERGEKCAFCNSAAFFWFDNL